MNGIWQVFSLLPHRHRTFARKTDAVFRLFRPVHPVVHVSARTGWELDTLVSALMTALPDHAASPPDDPPAGRAAHGICPGSGP